MHRKAIVHIMTKVRMKSDAFTAEIDAIEELSEKYWIKNVIYYKWEKIEYKDLINKLEKFGILLYNYSNKEDLKEQILNFNKEYEIIFVSTPLELLVNSVNEVKQILDRPISDFPDIFRDKYLQRELIAKHNHNLWVKFLEWTPEDLNINEIEEKIWYPFIIKPVDWLQSSWVAKVKSKTDFESYIKSYMDFHDRLKNRWVDNKYLIVEEFIDWNLYSIDYYVDSEWNSVISKPVKVILWVDIWFEDYANVARVATNQTEEEFKWKRLKTFINSTIKATWIKNVFVHHEFKINSKWELKTIELNWRIGWWRLDLMKRTYWLNLFEFLVNPNLTIWKLKESNIYVNIYATKRWTLIDFNRKLLEKIKKRKTVYWIDLDESAINKEIWLTKDWFVKIWAIKMASKIDEDVVSDFKYIKKNYKDLLKIEENIENEKKWIFKKFKSLFSRKK